MDALIGVLIFIGGAVCGSAFMTWVIKGLMKEKGWKM